MSRGHCGGLSTLRLLSLSRLCSTDEHLQQTTNSSLPCRNDPTLRLLSQSGDLSLDVLSMVWTCDWFGPIEGAGAKLCEFWVTDCRHLPSLSGRQELPRDLAWASSLRIRDRGERTPSVTPATLSEAITNQAAQSRPSSGSRNT